MFIHINSMILSFGKSATPVDLFLLQRLDKVLNLWFWDLLKFNQMKDLPRQYYIC